MTMALLLAAVALATAGTPSAFSLPTSAHDLDLAGATTRQTAYGNSHLLIISGLSGEERYRESFHEWAVSLITAAEERMGIPPERITYLAEDVELDPERVDGRSTAETVEATLLGIAADAESHDRIAIVLIGHGSARDGESRISLPGPDLSASDFARLLGHFTEQRIALVNTASSSGDFVAPLSGPNRAIITATRDGRQNNETVFAGYFIEAYSQDVADLDKDDRVSLLEAYGYAIAEVHRFYESEGRMRTETALLDDNGDAEGSHEPDPAAGDGFLSSGFFLADDPGLATAGDQGGADAIADPELRALYEQKLALERRIDELRRIKDTMDPAAYMVELEALLVDLALTERAIRERGGIPGGDS
jgi:hypothetical protein